MSDIKIEIVGPVESRSGTGPRGEYTVYSQPAYLHKPSSHYPEKVSFNIESVNDQLAPGFYEIDFDKSLSVGQWNSLGFNRNLTLIPSQPVRQSAPSPNQQSLKSASA